MAKQAPATDMGRDIFLEIVLEAFSKPPFEPLEEVSDPALTLKTVFLLAISSLKRVGDIQALSVAFLLGLCTWDGQSLPLPQTGVPALSALLHPTAGCTADLLPSSLPGPRPAEDWLYVSRASIYLSYELSDLSSPLGVKAHSTLQGLPVVGPHDWHL